MFVKIGYNEHIIIVSMLLLLLSIFELLLLLIKKKKLLLLLVVLEMILLMVYIVTEDRTSRVLSILSRHVTQSCFQSLTNLSILGYVIFPSYWRYHGAQQNDFG